MIKKAFREADTGPVLTANKPKQQLSPLGPVCVSGPVLSSWKFEAPGLGAIEKGVLKLNYEVLRKKEKLLAKSIKSPETKEPMIFKQAGSGVGQMNPGVCKPRLIPR